ncbi:MAG TPA: AraC family transcriptional regulator [Vicinamibacterales bacterium]|nr:AraC family transcriptional regulator [Vicinamibacterales bacterium]
MEEKILFQRRADVPGVETLWVENSRRCYRWFHETYSVNIGLNFDTGPGHYDFDYRGKSFRARLGECMLLEPGETHNTTFMSGAATFQVAFFSPAGIEEAARELGLPGWPHLGPAVSGHPELFASFKKFHESLGGQRTTLERQVKAARCVRLLLELAAEKKPKPFPWERGHKAVRRAVDLLRASWNRNVTLEELAGAAGVSRFHLLRLFASETGMPPHAYQIHLRLSKAREFIRAGMNLSHAAAESGFADQSHMSRKFKRHLGMTPAQYRD